MYALVRPLLFCLQPETAHNLTLRLLDRMPSCLFTKPKPAPVEAMGLTFAHPVGLAAGLDKNGDYLDALAKLGFSFIEIGTVTPRPQNGNPKPRLFRILKAEALINRMGFNNKGVDVLVEQVARAHYDGVLGINIGKNKDTPTQHAVSDYLYCLEKVYSQASYVTINISSPNTPDLRQLQQGSYLDTLLLQLKQRQQALADQQGRKVPLVVKVSPDETEETLKRMAELILRHGIEGVIATNTTCVRAMLPAVRYAQEQGGLSGKPLLPLSAACLRVLKHYVGDSVTLIGVGGVDSLEAAQALYAAGADLIQIYSGLIFKGPRLILELTDD